MIAHLRIILDHNNDIFRDIHINTEDTLEQLHHTIVSAFTLSPDEMAAFYISNEEWEQGEEIPLLSMQEGSQEMKDITISATFNKEDSRLLYIQDFLTMWRFMIELEELLETSTQKELPATVLSFGEMPSEAPNVKFVSEEHKEHDTYGYVLDDFNDFEQFDEFNEY
ncbi:MAG: hypothetical protein CMP75_00295 [Flavobacteriales bacterium]|nr:hypothetical protein [Flavobacteriales bacterium]